MKISLSFMVFGIGLLLYVWAAMSTHALFWDNDRTKIGAALIVSVLFVILGAIGYFI